MLEGKISKIAKKISPFCLILIFCILIFQSQKSPIKINADEVPIKINVDEVTFKMESCKCSRTLKAAKTSEKEMAVKLEDTTCGIDAFRRGMGQKIVGFSFYGDINSKHSIEKGYFEGIAENLRLLQKYYPGWTMRLYHSFEEKDSVMTKLCDLACNDQNLDLCDAENLPGTPMKDATKVFAMNWRLIFLSREIWKVRLNSREYAAVKQWLESDKDFHFMRDHPQHGTTILGSGWGSKLLTDDVRRKWKKAWEDGLKDKIVWASRNLTGPDQVFLSRFVWPWSKSLAMSHDSYLCRKYPNTQPFPTERKPGLNNFVASVVKQNMSIWVECPEVCRPQNHKDWIHC